MRSDRSGRRIFGWLRDNALGLVLVVAAIFVLSAGSRSQGHYLEPRAMSVDEASALSGPGPPRYVTLDATADATARFYGIVPHDDILQKPERLTPFAPDAGVPLNGPDAVPVADWPSYLGGEVRITGALAVVGYVVEDKVRSESWRTYLATITVGARTVFVRHKLMQFDRSFALQTFPSQLKEWLAQGAWRGQLRRGLPDALAARIAPSERQDAWLVDTESSADGGRFVYSPIRGSAGKVWVQAPIGMKGWEETKPTGLLLPPGSHAFVPPPGTPVALLRLDSAAIADYLELRRARFQFAYWALSIALGAAGIGLVAAREGRQRLFTPEVPDYLAPFAPYLLPEPARRSFPIAASGVAMLSIGGVLLAFGFLVTLSLRQWASDGGLSAVLQSPMQSGFLTTLALTFVVGGVCLGIGQKLYPIGRGVWSRGATSLLRRDKRDPVLYLRSFRADRHDGLEHDLVKMASTVGPTVTIGRPNETLPPLGAARLYVDHAHWQEVVTVLARRASLVVLRIGDTEGFRWEWKHLTENVDSSKVVIWVPMDGRSDLYAAFAEDVAAEDVAATTSRRLPALDERAGSTFVSFDKAWASRWLPNAEHPLLPSPLFKAYLATLHQS